MLVLLLFFFLLIRRPPRSTLFPYTPLSRSQQAVHEEVDRHGHRAHEEKTGELTSDLARHRANVAFCACRPEPTRSEEHTSELQSRQYLVCRLLLEKKKYKI